MNLFATHEPEPAPCTSTSGVRPRQDIGNRLVQENFDTYAMCISTPTSDARRYECEIRRSACDVCERFGVRYRVKSIYSKFEIRVLPKWVLSTATQHSQLYGLQTVSSPNIFWKLKLDRVPLFHVVRPHRSYTCQIFIFIFVHCVAPVSVATHSESCARTILPYAEFPLFVSWISCSESAANSRKFEEIIHENRKIWEIQMEISRNFIHFNLYCNFCCVRAAALPSANRVSKWNHDIRKWIHRRLCWHRKHKIELAPAFVVYLKLLEMRAFVDVYCILFSKMPRNVASVFAYMDFPPIPFCCCCRSLHIWFHPFVCIHFMCRLLSNLGGKPLLFRPLCQTHAHTHSHTQCMLALIVYVSLDLYTKLARMAPTLLWFSFQ